MLYSGSKYIQYLCYYHFFNSCALAVCANMNFMDKLLLRMNIRLEYFGFIRCLMYLLPAVGYQILTPWIQKYHWDVKICLWGYVFRVLLPCTLPFLQMTTADTQFLTTVSLFVFPISMMLACFANNSLLVIYREVIPGKSFNKITATLQMLMGIPSTIASFALAWYLDLFAESDNHTFFLAFGIIQTFTVIFEQPAVFFLRKIQIASKAADEHSFQWRDFLQPYQDKIFRTILQITLFHSFFAGAASSYLTVYLLNVMKLSLSAITWISGTINILIYVLLPFSGRWMDKTGYARCFLFLIFGITAGFAVFCSFWGAIWFLPFFAILTWNGRESLFGGVLTFAETFSCSHSADVKYMNSYISAFGIAQNFGMFTGAFCSAFLFKILAEHFSDESVLFHTFFLCLMPVILILTFTAFRSRKTEYKKPSV